MKPQRRCRDCPRLLGRYSTADRCRDCYLVWVAGPQPTEPDWVVVERLIAGEPTTSTAVERAEAVTRMTARGWSAVEIATRLGCSDRTVVRIRGRLVAA